MYIERVNTLKNVVDLKKWPQSVPQPSMKEVMENKKAKRKKKINDLKKEIAEIRNSK